MDGLRAIAVIAVIIFHAFPTLLPGGFIGVDVFFVIGGFLITGIIQKRTDVGVFSFLDFYKRRARRLFPALALVIAATLVFGWFLLLPWQYEELGKEALAGSLFVPNLLYWYEAGYFDVSAKAKPLLHLWSLGVEEQFYAVWPLLIAVLSRARTGSVRDYGRLSRFL